MSDRLSSGFRPIRSVAETLITVVAERVMDTGGPDYRTAPTDHRPGAADRADAASAISKDGEAPE